MFTVLFLHFFPCTCKIFLIEKAGRKQTVVRKKNTLNYPKMFWAEKPRGQRTQKSVLKPNTNICLFMGYRFTSIPLEPKPVCCAR